MTQPRAWLIGLALVAAGCAPANSAMMATQVGQYVPGRYLANVIVLPAVLVPDRCRVPRAKACAWVVWREETGRSIGEAWQVYRSDVVTPRGDVLTVVAHELCHIVAALQGLADPCHDADSGPTR